MKHYRVFLCGANHEHLVDPNPDCSNAAAHARQPRGYLEWHDWAEEMAETHDQEKCVGCGRWLILKPRDPSPAA